MRLRRWQALATTLVLAILGSARVATAQQCGPTDVTFIIDNSGSMQPVIDEVKTQVGKIADAVQDASGGDYQFGLITMPANNVVVSLDMTPKNRTALDAAVQTMATVNSTGAGIAYDEALDTVLNHLAARQGSVGQQTGTFTGTWRGNASKIIIIITDTGPQGFDTELGTHGIRAHDLAGTAANMDIRIAGIFVPDGGGTNPVIDEPILQDVAAVTGGIFKETAADASDLSTVIVDIVNSCGRGSSGLLVDPTDVAVSNGESIDVKVTNYRPGTRSTLVYGSSGLPTDSTATFTTVAKPDVTGTDQQTLHISIGPDTPAGVYVLEVTANHGGNSAEQSNFVLVNVGCTPPIILGTPGNQPANTTAGSNGRATLHVQPVGSLGFHYQWYQGHSGSTAFPIAGGTSQTLTTPVVTSPTEFWVRITNACGSRDSATAVVTPAQ